MPDAKALKYVTAHLGRTAVTARHHKTETQSVKVQLGAALPGDLVGRKLSVQGQRLTRMNHIPGCTSACLFMKDR